MRCTHLFSIVALILTTSALPAADNPVTSVQRSLKHMGFYYGNVSGQVDEETRSALTRFQIRSGLKPTGEMDNTTLQALAKAAAEMPPAESGGNTAPASVRERAHRTEISDREFLTNLNSADSGEPSPTAPAVSASPPPSLEPRRPRTVSAPSASPEPSESSTDAVNAEEVAGFVQRYLKAAEAPQPDEEISFYADRVDYFDSGRVSRQFVAKDQASYYRRWPKREFTLVGAPQLVATKGPRATVRFRVRYTVTSASERASGSTENVVQLQREADGLKISGIHERKARD